MSIFRDPSLETKNSNLVPEVSLPVSVTVSLALCVDVMLMVAVGCPGGSILQVWVAAPWPGISWRDDNRAKRGTRPLRCLPLSSLPFRSERAAGGGHAATARKVGGGCSPPKNFPASEGTMCSPCQQFSPLKPPSFSGACMQWFWKTTSHDLYLQRWGGSTGGAGHFGEGWCSQYPSMDMGLVGGAQCLPPHAQQMNFRRSHWLRICCFLISNCLPHV